MEKNQHFTLLENMYLAAPINKFYKPKITISEGESEIEITIVEDYYHSGGAVHGSVYFKMLDDAAFFAANSLETEVFVLTITFTTYITRPVSSGIIRAVGRVVNQNRTQFIVEAVAYDSQDREIARGSGVFVRSKMRLADMPGYGT